MIDRRMAFVPLVLWASVVTAAEVRGTVSAQGNPLAGVLITVEDREAGADVGPTAVSVVTGTDGRFSVSGLPHARAADLAVRATRLGYAPGAVQWNPDGTVQVALTPTANVADQVPASAWMANFPLDERGSRFVAGQCAGCHQFPSRQVQRFAANLASLDEGARREQWAEATRAENVRIKENVWRGAVQLMRNLALRFSADSEVRWGLDESHPEYAKLMTADFSLFNQAEEAAGAQALAAHLTTDFTRFDLADYPAAATPLALTPRGRITEYALHTGGWTREVATLPGGKDVFVVEDDADRLGRLNPQTGRVRWRHVEGTGKGLQGPHTINPDRDGKVWVSLEESYTMGRLDPATDQWRIYEGFGDFAIAHDSCVDHERFVTPDAAGRIWLTLIGNNHLASLHPETGAIEQFPMPFKPGEASFHAALYSCVITADRKQVWFTQLNGIVGGFNIETGKLETSLDFPLGTIPHRMAIDDQDVIYVALSGDGQVLAYDTRAKKELARFDLPDRNASPYAVTWDPRRHVLWVTGTNTDVIYRLDPETGAVAQIPLPRARAYLRMIDIDRASGDLWTTYAHLPVGRGPNYALRIEPGDLTATP